VFPRKSVQNTVGNLDGPTPSLGQEAPAAGRLTGGVPQAALDAAAGPVAALGL